VSLCAMVKHPVTRSRTLRHLMQCTGSLDVLCQIACRIG
jgi:hypothetical protein